MVAVQGEIGCFGGGVFGSLLVEVFDEQVCERLFFRWVDDFRDGGEGAENGVGDDVFDELAGVGQVGGLLAGEVERGDLESVEEQAGAAVVDLAGGDAAEDLGDGKLDGGAVLGGGELEVGVGVGDRGGLAGGVVVVAEVLAAERG